VENLIRKEIKLPTYEFTCTKCKKVKEVTCSYDELTKIEPTLRCDRCGSSLKRKLAPFVTHFNYTRGK
jgi:putative FmdB family regulatory protein